MSENEQKTVIHHMRMSKADDADLDVAFRLIHLVDAIGDDYYPGQVEGAPTFFDEDNFEHLLHLYRQIKEISESSGSLHRIAGAANVLLNPKNNLIDPDDDCIELHPDLKAAQQAADEVEGLRAKVAELEAELNELWEQKPVGEVMHADVLPGLLRGKDEGLYRHEFLANFRLGIQSELFARPVPVQLVNVQLLEALKGMLNGADCSDYGEEGIDSPSPLTHQAGAICPVCKARDAIASAEAQQAGPVRLTDAEIGAIEREAKASPAWDLSTHPMPLARAIERAVLRANGFVNSVDLAKPTPCQGHASQQEANEAQEPAFINPDAPCRNALRRDGKPFPKSSCQRCGPLIRPGWKCADGVEV